MDEIDYKYTSCPNITWMQHYKILTHVLLFPSHILLLFQSHSFSSIVVTYKIRVFFEGAQKEVFSSILKKHYKNTKA